MAYYYSDADQYPNYHHYQNHHYIHYHNNNQYNEYMYNNYHHYNATSQTLAPQPYYHNNNYNNNYSDGFNFNQVSNDYYYSYGNLPFAYYSVAGSSQPERVEWEGGGVSTDLIVGVEEDDEAYDDFDDYDPTPYDGGYDIVKVYGKPLPASDAICYPRSGTGNDDSEMQANVVTDQPVSNKAIVPVDDFECHNDNDLSESECESDSESCRGSEISEGDKKVSGDVVKLSETECTEEISYKGEREFEKVEVNNEDDAPKAYELTSELPGFYDGLYGYLPCLNKKKNKTVVNSDDYVVMNKPDDDPWKAAADFIFGSLNPYAD